MFNCNADTADRPFVHRGMPDASGSPFEPMVLLADLDHSINSQDSYPSAPRTNTGTPMFIAVECASAQNTDYNHYFEEDGLKIALQGIESDEKGRAAFAAAFPNGDQDFMQKLEKVLDEEIPKRGPAKDENLSRNQEVFQQRPLHDVESVFWVFLWAFARAQPLDLQYHEVDPGALSNFKYFCETMLHHVVQDGDTEAPRAQWLYGHHIHRLFHPRLAVFERIFDRMSRYLSIPWHLYDPDKIDKTHAFVAARRLILNALTRNDVEDLDIPLDTEWPRATSKSDRFLREKYVAAQMRPSTADPQPLSLALELRETKSSHRACALSGSTSAHAALVPMHQVASGSGAVTTRTPFSIHPITPASSSLPCRRNKRKLEPDDSDDLHPKKKIVLEWSGYT